MAEIFVIGGQAAYKEALKCWVFCEEIGSRAPDSPNNSQIEGFDQDGHGIIGTADFITKFCLEAR